MQFVVSKQNLQKELGFVQGVVDLSGNGFTDRATVRVEDGTILFLETDKPIYKPGETIRIRVVALDVNLRPVATTATVEAQDAKGIKVFKKGATTDAFGMATLDLPLSTEPNLGVWKLRAAAPDVAEITLTMPNRHRVLANLAPFGRDNPNAVFVATDEPHGLISGTLRRA